MVFLVDDGILSYGLAAQRLEKPASTDDRGEFTARGPRAWVCQFYLTFANSSNRVEYVPIGPLDPGELRDLGVVKPIVLTENP